MTKPRSFRTIVERNVPGKMRDGITLYADIWRPDGEGKFPVLLCRMPYDKSSARLALSAGVDAVRTVGEGYVVIYQDVRGRLASEGEWTRTAEFNDGYDSVEWAAQLPFSDGNVGMFGSSYNGYTQWMAAAAKPPHLKAIFPQKAGGTLRNAYFPGNAFGVGSTTLYAALMTPDSLLRQAREEGADIAQRLAEVVKIFDHLPEAYEKLPLLGGNPSLSTAPSVYAEWLINAENRDFWEKDDLGDRWRDVDIPVFQLGGWHDLSTFAADMFARLREQAPSERARQAQKLIMGPWTHSEMLSDVVSDIYMGMSATAPMIDLAGLHIRWFDHWLKGKDTGLLKEPPVRIFVMGDNAWRSENEWPLARTQWTNFYFRSQGHANTRSGDGLLSTSAPDASEPSDVFLYDPRNPVPTLGGPTLLHGGAIGAHAGPRDQARAETRADVLVYSSPVLKEEVEVTGPISVTLFAATSAPDTDWTVKLTDVYPDGRSFNLVEGVVRARYREAYYAPELLTPGKVYEYKIPIQATSNVFKEGHRIRVQVSSSNFPRISRNPNTGGPIATETEMVPAVQTILHDAEHPSHIRLPVIPRTGAAANAGPDPMQGFRF